MSPDAAIAELDRIGKQCKTACDGKSPRMAFTKWHDITFTHSGDEAVAAKALDAIGWAVANKPLNAAAAVGAGVIPIVFDIMAGHVSSVEVQHKGCDALRWLVDAHSPAADAIASSKGFDARIYAAMDEHVTVTSVQWRACWAIESIAKHSVVGKRVLLSGRAVDVCMRAKGVAPTYADKALMAVGFVVWFHCVVLRESLICACHCIPVCIPNRI